MERLKPRLFIISAPSGTGKTSIFKQSRVLLPKISLSVSYTTRSPREGEIDGSDYFFISVEDFLARIDNNEFIEWAKVYDNYYGTSRVYIDRLKREDKIVILDIDVQGAMQLQKIKDLDAVFIFIMPPSLEELSRRLISRKTESQDLIKKRLMNAEHEISFKGCYDYQIVNDILEDATNDLLRIIVKECNDSKDNNDKIISNILTSLKKRV